MTAYAVVMTCLFLVTLWLGVQGRLDTNPPIVKIERPIVMPCGGAGVRDMVR